MATIPFHKAFDKCPVCGSAERFLETLSQELKDRGLARQEWNMRYDARQGAVYDADRTIMIPIGASLPGYSIETDICMNCGTVYAVSLRRLEGKTAALPSDREPPQSSFRGN